jgi:hypothetical protein
METALSNQRFGIRAVLAIIMIMVIMVISMVSARAETTSEPKPELQKALNPATPAPSAKTETTEPQKVYVGIYVNDIYGVSLADYKFEADYYIWFRWKGALKPLSTFQTANGRINKKDGVVEKKIGDWNYASCRVTSTFQEHWDLRHFPFDTQILALEFEDNDNDIGTLQFVSDTENCALDPDIRLPGWQITGAAYAVKEHQYTTNYGDTSLPSGNKSVWSRFCLTINAARPGYGYFFKLCWGLLIAMLIALVPMFLKPTDGPRFGLGTGALFAAMANAYVISNALPKDTGMTTADMFFVLALSAIFISVCESIVSLRLFTGGKVDASQRLDRFCFWIVLAAYTIGGALLIAVPVV